MDFDLTKEQKMIRDEVRHFARKEIAPLAEELEQTGEYPYDIYAKMAELGLLGTHMPEEYGGLGLAIRQKGSFDGQRRQHHQGQSAPQGKRPVRPGIRGSLQRQEPGLLPQG